MSNQKIDTISSKFGIMKGNIIVYSAKENYNLDDLVDKISWKLRRL